MFIWLINRGPEGSLESSQAMAALRMPKDSSQPPSLP